MTTTASLSNLRGQRFGRLVVIDRAYSGKHGRWWHCLCDCGQQAIRSTSQLRDKAYKDKSCKCARRDSIRRAHEAAIRKTTKWRGPYKQELKVMIGNMKKRCLKPGNSHFKYYGGRGITICEQWLRDTSTFYQWAIDNGYRPGLSIDRIDPNGNYCPENCRFIPLSRQSSNTRRNVFLTWRDETRTVSEWARVLGVRPQALQHRVDRGWDTSRIFTQSFRRSAA